MEILYVFVSGYYGHYRKNLHRTLSLPTGSINEYVFDYSTSVQEILHLNNISESGQGHEVIIVFLDRAPAQGKGYMFYPIRRAKYVCHQVVNENKVHFFLQLDDYIFPKDPGGISKSIERFNNIPKPSELNPTDDGPYVSIQGSILPKPANELNSLYYVGNEGWEAAVRVLCDTMAFRTPLKYEIGKFEEGKKLCYPIFYRIECRKSDNSGNETQNNLKQGTEKGPNEQRPVSYLEVTPNHTLVFKVYYFFPHTRESDKKILDLKPQVYIEDVITKEQKYDSISGDGDKEFVSCVYKVPKDMYEQCVLTIGINLRGAGDTEIFCPEVKVKLRAQQARAKTIFLLFLLVAVYLFATVIKSDIADIKQIGLCQYIQQNPTRFISEALQLVAIIGITYINGGKKLF